MSDYVKAKVIRLPFPKSILEKCNADSCYDCENYLEELLGELYGSHANGKRKEYYFEVEGTDKADYIDLVLSYSYGEESGDYGFSFYLNENDLKKYKPMFEKVTTDFQDEDLRKVVYCYYNCSECPDHYDVVDDVFDNL